ncbi:hypothetical protein ABW19_dt0207404 [Dactylella cylindrospora]|nr:hypothetical protein ABW19_dt0207404 [Dactylella cylindrospora]
MTKLVEPTLPSGHSIGVIANKLLPPIHAAPLLESCIQTNPPYYYTYIDAAVDRQDRVYQIAYSAQIQHIVIRAAGLSSDAEEAGVSPAAVVFKMIQASRRFSKLGLLRGTQRQNMDLQYVTFTELDPETTAVLHVVLHDCTEPGQGNLKGWVRADWVRDSGRNRECAYRVMGTKEVQFLTNFLSNFRKFFKYKDKQEREISIRYFYIYESGKQLRLEAILNSKSYTSENIAEAIKSREHAGKDTISCGLDQALIGRKLIEGRRRQRKRPGRLLESTPKGTKAPTAIDEISDSAYDDIYSSSFIADEVYSPFEDYDIEEFGIDADADADMEFEYTDDRYSGEDPVYIHEQYIMAKEKGAEVSGQLRMSQIERMDNMLEDGPALPANYIVVETYDSHEDGSTRPYAHCYIISTFSAPLKYDFAVSYERRELVVLNIDTAEDGETPDLPGAFAYAYLRLDNQKTEGYSPPLPPRTVTITALEQQSAVVALKIREDRMVSETESFTVNLNSPDHREIGYALLGTRELLALQIAMMKYPLLGREQVRGQWVESVIDRIEISLADGRPSLTVSMRQIQSEELTL